MKKFNLLILLTIIASSCAMFEHRDFANEMEYQADDQAFKPNHDFMVLAGDTGRDYRTRSEVMARTPLTENQKAEDHYDKALENELAALENSLSEEEWDSYEKYSKNFTSTSQKIYFLRLSSYDKSIYLRADGMKTASMSASRRNSRGRSPANYPTRSTSRLSSSIEAGMSMNDVVQKWGVPADRDVSGNPMLKNERWSYRRAGRTKYVYFEAGRVEGWSN